jgi:hypothetical protein
VFFLLPDGNTHLATPPQAKYESHVPVSIEEHLAQAGPPASSTAEARKPMCQKHGRELELYCETCKVPICLECGNFDHDGHEKVKLSEVTSNFIESIVGRIQTATTAGDKLKEASVAIKAERTAVGVNAGQARAHITATFKRVRQAHAAAEVAAKAQLEEVVNRKETMLDEQVAEANDASERITSGTALANATVDVANLMELAQCEPLFVKGLTAITNHGVALAPTCGASVAVVPTAALERVLQLLEEGVLAIVGTDTDPTQCTAVGGGLAAAHVGERAEFVLQAVDFEGKQRASGGDLVKFALAPVEGGGSGGDGGSGAAGQAADLGVSVVDGKNGTYACAYTAPPQEGRWELAVQIGGNHIQSSPFPVEITDRGNFWNPDDRHPNIILGKDNTEVTNAQTIGVGTNYLVRANKGYTVGRHYWETTITKFDGGGAGYNFMGVATKAADVSAGRNNSISDPGVWAVELGSYQCYEKGFKNKIAPWSGAFQPTAKSGAKVGMLLDMDAQTLTAYVNGKSVGQLPFTFPPTEALFPVLGAGALKPNVYVTEFDCELP